MSRIRRYAGTGATLVLSVMVALWSQHALAGNSFDERLVALDHGVDAPPLKFRLADGAGLLAVGAQGDQWRFSVISLTDGEVIATGMLPDAAFFYDAGDPLQLGVDQICLLDEQGVAALDPISGKQVRVIDVDSLYHDKPWPGPGASDFVRDIDGDGNDDVLVPQFSSWLLARWQPGGFEQYLLDVRPRVAVNQTRISYEPREPQIGDVDGDGLNDLVFLIDTEILTFVQSPSGSFSAPGRRNPIEAPLASEAQRALWRREDGQVDQSDLEIEEVEIVKDFNDDGVLDLLTERSISEGVFDRRSEYHLYLGQREGATVRYPAEPDGSVTSDGVQFDPLIVDVDGDGRLDLATPSTRLGLARVVGALFSGRISVDLNIYRMAADGAFPERSDYRTRFKVEFDLKTGLSRYPAVAIADFDGDGNAELMVQQAPEQLTLYQGVSGPTLFASDGQELSLPLPRSGQMVKAGDVNGDGRADLVVRYGPADGAERHRELRILLSMPPELP
ncbi:MAG: VCBS repeat-containing protein [Gammaproteobacteria bacterium]